MKAVAHVLLIACGQVGAMYLLYGTQFFGTRPPALLAVLLFFVLPPGLAIVLTERAVRQVIAQPLNRWVLGISVAVLCFYVGMLFSVNSFGE